MRTLEVARGGGEEEGEEGCWVRINKLPPNYCDFFGIVWLKIVQKMDVVIMS